MMVKTYYILLVIIILGVNACNSEKEQKDKKSKEGFINYKNDSLGFEISIPENWIMHTEKGDTKSITFFEPKSDSLDSFKESIVVWVEEMPMAISDSVYAQAAITQIKISNPNLEIENKGIELNSTDTLHAFTFKFVTDDSSKYYVNGYTTVNKLKGYNISFTGLEKDKENHKVLFDDIKNSIKVLR